MENISNPVLRDYSFNQIEKGTPALETTSRVIYGEALKMLEAGNREKAMELLILSGSLSCTNSDPYFTLARIELLSGHPDFLFHFIEGLNRQAGSFRNQGLLALNLSLHLIAALLMTLIFMLLILMVKYWQFLNHKIKEVYAQKYSFPPARYMGVLIILSLLIMRLGIALYIALFIGILWTFMARREKATVTFLVILIGAASFAAPFSNILFLSVDRDSITGRLALLNESGGDQKLIDSIQKIKDKDFEAEKQFALGTIMYRLGRYEEARDHLLSSVSENKDFAIAYLNLGNVYFMQSDYNKALAGYQNVLSIDPANAVAHFNIGQAYINKMLFAESSSALKMAGTHGIDRFRKYHPSINLRALSVYDEGFPNHLLWSIAKREAALRSDLLIEELFRPWLLFPFKWLGYLLLGSILFSVIASSRISGNWRVFKCDNCGKATCPVCSNQDTGLSLCQDCSNLIKKLSSIKVMEALLRHRRQKAGSSAENRTGWKTRLIPGAAYILHGKTVSGMIWMLIDFSAILTLVWSGFYFSDPRALITPSPVWRILISMAVIAMGYLASLRERPAVEQRNFKILPPEFIPEVDEKTSIIEPRSPVKEKAEHFEAFLDSL
ncbi:MAG: tetratricopeptide repeat protein [Candidatus Krumholzibacteriota bacterium]|nr:tetratricopeptide repeat protein [Candidatus Krumholzibacteriota bacterium]